MIVMPGNSWVVELAKRYPNKLGMLLAPGETRNPHHLPFGIDNGRYMARINGWDESRWLNVLNITKRKERTPEWIVVPDVVGDCKQTLKEWKEWSKRLREIYGWPLALAVQNDMTISMAEDCNPDVIFVGGSARWKWQTLSQWTRSFKHVHCGRVGTDWALWRCGELGCKSVDGSGYFKGQSREPGAPLHYSVKELYSYLDRSSRGLKRPITGFGRRG